MLFGDDLFRIIKAYEEVKVSEMVKDISSIKALRWEFVPIPGIPIPIWLTKLDLLAKFIQNEGLKPIDEKLSSAVITRPPLEAKFKDVTDIRGGIRAPHLHYGGKLYILDNVQWKKFSEVLIADFKEKLNSVNTISFEKALEISDVIDSL